MLRHRLHLRGGAVVTLCMLANETLWPCTPTDACPMPGDVRVWAAWLDMPGEEMTGFWSSLSTPERERASRFTLERERARFVAARGLLRVLLGSCLGTEPHKIEFTYSAKGKPSLGGEFTRSGLQFNLAHSGGLSVFAVARQAAVGVDVEQIRPVPDLSALIERFLSARECAELKKLSGQEQTLSFFRLWTRKEAWLKATGEGITRSLASIEVLGAPGDRELYGASHDGSGQTRLCLLDLEPAPGFLGALAAASL